MRDLVEWAIAIFLAVCFWAVVVWVAGLLVVRWVEPSTAALPPMAHSEAAEPPAREISVACGFHLVAFYVAVDVATLEPLGQIGDEPVEMAVLPAPCPDGFLE